MATRRFLYMSSDGPSYEQEDTDDIKLGALVIGAGSVSAGNISLSTTGKVVNMASATADGDALAYGQSGANLAGLTIDTAALAMTGQKITGMADGTDANDAVNKSQLDNVASGIKWKDPVEVLEIVSDADQGGSPPAGTTGEAYVVNNWGGGYSDGDIVEYDGATWNVIVANSGGEPPDGTRVLVIGSGAAGSFATKENNIGTYDATGDTWSFEAPSEGWAVLVTGDGSVYENIGYTYDAGTTTWIQFTGAGQINAGAGLDKSGNTLSVKFGDGITELPSDYVGVDLTANKGLQLAGTSPNKTLEILLNATNPGLVTDSNGLYVLEDGAHGIVRGASGVEIEIDDTPDTLDVDADGLKVVGLPSLFKINDTAVSANVTAPNLGTLTAGAASDADALHTHPSLGTGEYIADDYDVAVALAKSDPVYFDATVDQVDKADASVDAKAWVIGVAAEDIAVPTPGSGTIIFSGVAAGVLTGATAGNRYYLDDGGGIVVTSPPVGNMRVILIGFAINATDLFVRITDYGKKAA